jgi:phage terminase large subunit
MQPQSALKIKLPYNYEPRDYQLKALVALDSGIKRIVLTWHRRSGKDITIFNWCIKELAKTTCTCFYVMPTYSQAKKVIWDAVNNDGYRILDYIPKELVAQKNAQEMKIRLTNGSLFQLIGSDNIDSLMGTNPKIVVFSEYALQDPAAWDYIRPILKVNGGYAIFISTPRGRNHFYDLFRNAQVNEGWFAQKLSIEDTKVLTKEDVKQEMVEGMSEELALQEYYCSFDRGVEGSYYSKLISKMREEERICPLNHDPYKLVHCSFDLGWDDSTALIFFQISGDTIKIIDCEERSSTTLAEWKKILMERGYKYGFYLFPHDVEQIDGLGSGCTRKEILEDLQIPVTTVPKALIADGIESVKSHLSSKIMIDSKKCQPLIKSIENYHREWDDKHKVYGNKPRHDWSSHYCDSLRYLVQGLKFIMPGGSMENDVKALKNYFG